jgi:hypothetical protein
MAAWTEDGVLTMANQALSELFMLPAGAAKPGLTLREFFTLACQGGALEEDVIEDTLANSVAMFSRGEAVSFVERLSLGRMVKVSYRPLRSGGWLAT